jgi:hypothetical protein
MPDKCALQKNSMTLNIKRDQSLEMEKIYNGFSTELPPQFFN